MNPEERAGDEMTLSLPMLDDPSSVPNLDPTPVPSAHTCSPGPAPLRHEQGSEASPPSSPLGRSQTGLIDGGQWWHVNRTGFPIAEETWEEMWRYVTETHPSGPDIARSIRGRTKMKVPLPTVPTIRESHPVSESLTAVQSYLQELQYNHTGTQFFEIRKNRPLSRLMETAKEIIQESLPIKCLEAVVLALYLTAPLTAVQRFAISFKSRSGDTHYRHIVLAVSSNGCYGALGLSRRKNLMYKPLIFKSLVDLVQDFVHSYQQYNHIVLKVNLSGPVVHDIHSCEQIQWKFLSLNVSKMEQGEVKKTLEKFSRAIRTMS